jgi:hypothetical protein
MNICDKTFALVKEHLNSLGYDGSVCLCCDDTKLFSAFRLYWDVKEKLHYIVGGVDGRYRVPKPDDVRTVIEQAKLKKATKVCTIVLLITK